MSYLLKALMNQNGYMAPAGDDGSTGGGAVDRGDDFAPTGEDNSADTSTTTSAEDADTTDDSGDKTEDKSEDKAEDEDQPRDKNGKFIPKDRFDEAVRKERAEKEELARRVKEFEDKEAQRNVAADFAEANKVVKDMIKQHSSLLADGEIDKAADLMEKILELKEEISERKAAAKADAAKTAAKEEVRYDALVAKLEADYPQINPEADEFDRDSVRKVQAYMTGLMQTQRMSPSQALKEAVETILGMTKKDDGPSKQQAEDLGMRRKQDAVKKAMDAQKKQPASTRDVGLDHDKQGGALDASAVMKMSWDEFVKLPDAKLAELRGDFV